MALLPGADFDQCMAASLARRFAEALLGDRYLLEGRNPCEATTLATTVAAAGVRDAAGGNGADADEEGAADEAARAAAGGVETVLPCGPSGLRALAEASKRRLSSEEAIFARCVAPAAAIGGACEVVTVEMTRDAFENECSGLLGRALGPVEALLNEALMPREEVDEVVLVGGSTRIPAVRHKLKEFFGLDHLNQEIDPDLTIAIGAASVVD